MAESPTLTVDELVAITGYRRPGDQLRELLKLGYYRARRSVVTGAVILERPHYEAVARGVQAEAPRVRVPRVRPVASC